jgi:hypothetical protein
MPLCLCPDSFHLARPTRSRTNTHLFTHISAHNCTPTLTHSNTAFTHISAYYCTRTLTHSNTASITPPTHPQSHSTHSPTHAPTHPRTHSPVDPWCRVILSHCPPFASVPLSCAVRLHCRGPMPSSIGPGRPDAGSGVPPAHPPLLASGGTPTSAHTTNGPPKGGGGGG